MKPEVDDERNAAKRVLGVTALVTSIIVPPVVIQVVRRAATFDVLQQIPDGCSTWLLLAFLLMLVVLGPMMAILSAFLNRHWLRYASVAVIVFYALWVVAIVLGANFSSRT
jgi:threonine/homoserine/homoserine lactone efflux protein